MFKQEYIENARERDGDARNARPEAVDEALETDPRVGHGDGASLVEGGEDPSDHSHYPAGGALFKPSAYDTLEALAEHARVGDVTDLAAELHEPEDRVAKALDVHGLAVTPAERSEDDREGVIHVPQHGDVDTDHLREPVWTDARLLYALYIQGGMSTAEIKDHLETEMNRGRDGELPRWSVREREIREELAACGFLESEDGGRDRGHKEPRGSPADVATVSTAHLREE